MEMKAKHHAALSPAFGVASLLDEIRWREWRAGKLVDVATLVGFALLARGSLSLSDLVIGWSSLLYTGAYLSFGYTWNNYCDREADVLAGKATPARLASGVLSGTLSALSIVVMFLSVVVIGRLDAAVWLIFSINLFLAWSYSGPPLRFKERGVLGLAVGGFAQRAAPALLISLLLELPAPYACLWAGWMSIFGLRGMIIHQALDAASDRMAGLKTWGAKQGTTARALRVIRILVPVELSLFLCAMAPLLSIPGGGGAGLVISLLYAATLVYLIRVKRRKGEAISWLSFDYVPLSDIYCLAGAAVVAALMLKQNPLAALIWLAGDVWLRWPFIKQMRDHLAFEEGGFVPEARPKTPRPEKGQADHE